MLIARLKTWAKSLKQETTALALATRDPRTPRAARWLAGISIAYAISPIDLIPDFIPVIGQLDDLILVPAGLWMARRMIPPEVMEKYREDVRSRGVA